MQTTKQYEQEILPHVPELTRAALRLARDPALADDLMQESLTRAWQARERFQAGTNARAWMHRILFNTYINHYRQKRRETEAMLELRYAPKPLRREPCEELGDEVRAALAALSPEFREAVLLVDLDDMSYQDAAETLACPVGTVMSRLHRGRKQLRGRLQGYAMKQGVLREAA